MVVKKGFSLIEMLVVSSILIVVTTGAITSFSSIIKAQRYALRVQQLIDQGNYTMEYMINSLRMAKKEDGTISCLNLGKNYEYYLDGVIFIYPEEDKSLSCKAFFLSQGEIIEYDKERLVNNIALTPSDIEVIDFSVTIEDSANIQPLVSISLTIASSGFDLPEIKFETVVSQRDLNFPLE